MLKENKTSTEISELHNNAKRFCFLVENIQNFTTREWLSKVSLLLPRIHAVIGLIDDQRCATSVFPDINMDERFDFFCQMKNILGGNDDYEIGEEAVDHQLYGSLAEDLTDLYFEIKRGLDLITVSDDGIAAALSFWRDGFFLYWGKHLLDAERHLYELRVQQQI